MTTTAAPTPLTLYFNAAPATTTNAGGATYTNVQIPLTGDKQVLAYALAAEYLETVLYQQAYLFLTGQPLTITVPGMQPKQVSTATDALGYTYGGGSLNGVPNLNLGVATSDPIALYLAEFANVEAAHASFLQTALGGDPYPAGVGFAFGFHTLTTKIQVAQAVYGAEEIGVSAYTGAILSFTPGSPYLQTAASILGTEARHTAALAAAINSASGNGDIETAPMYNEGLHSSGIDVPLKPDQILNTGGGGVPGALTTSGSSAGGSGGTLGPITGPNGPAVGARNGTTTPTYNGFVFLASAA
jgi:hypothetical protein